MTLNFGEDQFSANETCELFFVQVRSGREGSAGVENYHVGDWELISSCHPGVSAWVPLVIGLTSGTFFLNAES